MGAGHAHTHHHRAPRGQRFSAEQLRRPPVMVLVGCIVGATLAALAVMALHWPDDERVDRLRAQTQYAAPGVTFLKAEVNSIQPPCPVISSESAGPPVDRSTCGALEASVLEGPDQGLKVRLDIPGAIARSGLGDGDTIRVLRIPPPTPDAVAIYSFDGIERTSALAWLVGLFVLVVIGVARLRGLLALLSLGLAGLVLFGFVFPALLSGESGVAVAMAGSALIMTVVLYFTHGLSIRTSAALGGTLVGVGLVAGIGSLGMGLTSLTGVSDDTGAVLATYAGTLDFQGLLLCALIIAGLGVLNDVTITQASAVWELREAAPGLSRATLYSRGMRIGRDHIASTIYTIAFAYAGSALAVLLLLSLYDRPLLELLSAESITEEIVRTVASGCALVLAVPLTTLIAAVTAPPATATPTATPTALTEEPEPSGQGWQHPDGEPRTEQSHVVDHPGREDR